MARTGKIARQCYAVRNWLNEKIRDGLPGTEIVVWLNQHPNVKEVLEEHFEGRPINEQNLTEWKAGGYPEWLRHVEARELIEDRIGEAEDIDKCAGELASVADCLSTMIAVQLDRCLQETVQDSSLSAAERREAVLSIAQASVRLRHASHAQRRLAIFQEDRWAQQEAASQAELAERRKQTDWLRSVREAMEHLQNEAEEKRRRRKPRAAESPQTDTPDPKPSATAPPEPPQPPPDHQTSSSHEEPASGDSPGAPEEPGAHEEPSAPESSERAAPHGLY